MKINRQKLQYGVLGLLCLSLSMATARAADENAGATDKKIDGSAYQTPAEHDKAGGYRSAADINSTSTSVAGAPTAANKASSLVGMDVRNGNDERLGKIKDIVIDLQSGKVSYAVLDGGTLLQSKMFAVPLNAFTVSADQKALILNTDKSRIQAARGFDKDAWPSVNNPDWGANTFWEQPGASQPASQPDQSRPKASPGTREGGY